MEKFVQNRIGNLTLILLRTCPITEHKVLFGLMSVKLNTNFHVYVVLCAIMYVRSGGQPNKHLTVL